MQTIGIIGGGAWGTALAQCAQRAGRDVRLWALETDVVRAINERNENARFLPGITLDPGIAATEQLAEAVSAADAGRLVSPAQHLRAVTAKAAPAVADGVPDTRQIRDCP